MPKVRRMALPVFVSSLFLLLAGTISSSMFAHAQKPAQSDQKLQPFTLYALSTDHLQQDGLIYDGLILAINGHVVGATTIVGTFRRVPTGTDAN